MSTGDHQDPYVVWKQLNRALMKKEGFATAKEFAKEVGIRPESLSSILGGRDSSRLTEPSLEKLVRKHVELGGFISPSMFQEWLDVLRACPEYLLDHSEEEKLRKAAEEEFEKRGVKTADALDKLLVEQKKHVRGMSAGEFRAWEERARKKGEFLSHIGIFHTWRDER